MRTPLPAARRQKWIDQSQPVNFWLKTPDLKTLSHMYSHAWHLGLKTAYYLRASGAYNVKKATVLVKKEMCGAVSEGGSGGKEDLHRRRKTHVQHRSHEERPE